MTVEPFDPAEAYTIVGQGPYAIQFPYADASHLLVLVILESGTLQLVGSAYEVAPASAEVAGNLMLGPEVADAFAGRPLLIQRDTAAEQGWAGQFSREKGLESQLDLLTMGLQDVQRGLRTAVRTTEPLLPFRAEEDRTVIWREGQPIAGPSADEIAGAQAHAEAAAAAVLEATALAQLVGASVADWGLIMEPVENSEDWGMI